MTRRGGTWTSRFAFASLLAGVFAACEVPEYQFPDEEPHCRNGLLDSELGETGVDCAGVCQRCGDGEPCNEPEDCVGGQCLGNVCLGESCGNEMLDPGEIAIDCGGDCAPCPADFPCVEAAGCESGVCTDSICQPASCNDNVKNGAETGEDCGGGDCNGCRGGEDCDEDGDCASMICAGNLKCTSVCDLGFAECDMDYELECETNVNTDINHCGECLNACDLAHATAACSTGECEIEQCEEPFDNCDADQATGCETNLESDPLHCGECNDACPDVNGVPECVDSTCRIDCNEGFDNCDNAIANGCETKISFDSRNCGECLEVCERGEDDEEPWCKAGECGSTACPEGEGDCDGDGDCDFDLTSDPESCKYCGSPCVVANGEPKCTESVCQIDRCDEGYENCDTDAEDGGYANGCEINTDTDVNNCGGCGIVCDIENATAKCEDGECKVDTCDKPFADCDEDGLDCETNYHESAEHCGACGTSCHDLVNTAVGECTLGVCSVETCDNGYGDCTSAAGCETVLADSKANCGACNRECLDRGGTNSCIAGACKPVCAEPNFNCDGDPVNGCEANTQSDPTNCNGCDLPCLSPEGTSSNACDAGACVPRCEDGYESCDSDDYNGCETHTAADKDNCGVCNRRCVTPPGSGSTSCVEGVCEPVCGDDYGNCDGDDVNGCEERLLSNVEHCGDCDRPCEDLHATSTSCTSAGRCVPICEEHYAACDDPWSGCDTDLRSNSDCGDCGAACAGGTPSCVVLADGYRCQASITLANDVEGQIAGTQLTLAHTAQAGTNRMLLLAIAADSGGGTLGANRPTSVRYGGADMSLAFERSGGGDFYAPDLYFYYLTEASGFAAVTTPVTITITSTSRQEAVVFANAAQFNGVRQVAPISAERGGTGNGVTMLAAALPIATPGSRVYSMTAWYWDAPPPTARLSRDDPAVVPTYTSPLLTAGQLRMKASGVVVSATDAAMLPTGTTTLTWDYGAGALATQSSIVIEPAVAE
jgi:hypothetical protein